MGVNKSGLSSESITLRMCKFSLRLELGGSLACWLLLLDNLACWLPVAGAASGGSGQPGAIALAELS